MKFEHEQVIPLRAGFLPPEVGVLTIGETIRVKKKSHVFFFNINKCAKKFSIYLDPYEHLNIHLNELLSLVFRYESGL